MHTGLSVHLRSRTLYTVPVRLTSIPLVEQTMFMCGRKEKEENKKKTRAYRPNFVNHLPSAFFQWKEPSQQTI